MKRNFLHLLAFLLLLVGCTEENSLGIDPISPPIEAVPMIIKSATVTAETRGDLLTGSIGVFLGGTYYEQINNRKYNFSSPSWVPDGGAVNSIYVGKSNAEVCAYYPFKAEFNSSIIQLNSKEYNSSDDIYFAKSRYMNNSPSFSTTTFTMTPAYARLTLSFVKKIFFESINESINVSKIELKNLLSSTSLNIYTGAYTSSTGEAGNTTVSSTSSTVLVPYYNEPPKDWPVDILLIPCIPASGGMEIVLTVSISGGPEKTIKSVIPTSSYQPQAGQHTKIKLVIDGYTVEPNSLLVYDYNYIQPDNLFFNP